MRGSDIDEAKLPGRAVAHSNDRALDEGVRDRVPPTLAYSRPTQTSLPVVAAPPVAQFAPELAADVLLADGVGPEVLQRDGIAGSDPVGSDGIDGRQLGVTTDDRELVEGGRSLGEP